MKTFSIAVIVSLFILLGCTAFVPQSAIPRRRRVVLAPKLAVTDAAIAVSHGASGVSKNLLELYTMQLKHHPYGTKAITSAVLACTGDAIAQFRAKSDDNSYDVKRGLGFLCFGALYTGIFQAWWFEQLR